MHPHEASTYQAEKRAGVYDDYTANDATTASCQITVITPKATMAGAIEVLTENHGELAKHWEDCTRVSRQVFTFDVTSPLGFDGMTEDEARVYLGDEHPSVDKTAWEFIW